MQNFNIDKYILSLEAKQKTLEYKKKQALKQKHFIFKDLLQDNLFYLKKIRIY
jgi:hypothetical protein